MPTLPTHSTLISSIVQTEMWLRLGGSCGPLVDSHCMVLHVTMTAIAGAVSCRYFAVTHGRGVQVWNAPGHFRDFAPFCLYRSYPGQYDDTTCIEWSEDSRYECSSLKEAASCRNFLCSTFTPLAIPLANPIPKFDNVHRSHSVLRALWMAAAAMTAASLLLFVFPVCTLQKLLPSYSLNSSNYSNIQLSQSLVIPV